MVLHATKQLLKTLRSSWSQWLSSQIHSDRAITLWFCVNHLLGRTPPTLSWSQPTLTSDTLPQRYSILRKFKLKVHGTELSKSTQSLKRRPSSMSSLTDGHLQATLATKDHTIAQLEATSLLEDPSQMRITSAACMQASRFLELTLRSCLDSGSTRLDLAELSMQVIIFGCQDIFWWE